MGRLKEDFIPDYITVAYGTNDWFCCSREGAIHHCTGFLKAVSENYPDSKIFVITPLWRKDHKEEKQFGSIEGMAESIRNITSKLQNVKVIEGFDPVPHNEEFFGALRLHPNDEGFTRYFESLCKKTDK